MATTVTSFTPNPLLFSYTGLPAGDLRANLPRAEVHFGGPQLSANVTVAAAGEDQRIDITCVLPSGYAYVLRELHLGMQNDDVADWEDNGFTTFQNATTDADRTTFVPMGINSPGGGANGPALFRWKNWTLTDPIRQVTLPAIGNQGLEFFLSLQNPVIDGAAGFAHFQIRFLQYDIEQAHHYAVNNPIPTR